MRPQCTQLSSCSRRYNELTPQVYTSPKCEVFSTEHKTLSRLGRRYGRSGVIAILLPASLSFFILSLGIFLCTHGIIKLLASLFMYEV